MKRILSLGLFALFASTLLLSSCSKYDEGSNFTLLSKKSRMVNNWHLMSANVDGFEINLSGISKHLELSKDGSAKYTESYFIIGQTLEEITYGTWEFNDDKSKLVLTETGATISDEYTILKLTKDEMKTQQIDASNGTVTINTWATK
jgi:hypothetical protein